MEYVHTDNKRILYVFCTQKITKSEIKFLTKI